MADPTEPHHPVAGGFPIFMGIVLGCVLGFVAGQPTVGFFAGLAIGVGIALALWLRDRPR